MANILKSLALLFAGALASVIGGLLIQSPLLDTRSGILGAAVVILILYGSGAISKIWHSCNLWKRKGNRLVAPKVGILSDMEWNLGNKEICSHTDISSGEWKKEIERQAGKNKVKIKVELIDVGKNFDPYIAILNPYGGVYPERDVKKFGTLNKILNYVNERGLFVNVADIPGYWAHNLLIKRRLDTTPPIYGIDRTLDGKILISPIRPFELTPFMEKLGLRVLNIENSELSRWNIEFEDKFNRIMEDIDEIKVHRVVAVERNVEAIIKPKRLSQIGVTTPLFFVNYGDGKLLISLVFFDKEYPQNGKMKEILAKIIIELIREKSKRNKLPNVQNFAEQSVSSYASIHPNPALLDFRYARNLNSEPRQKLQDY